MPSIEEIVASIAAQSKPKRKPKDGKDKDTRDKFYASRAWHALRYKILKKYGGRCQACGATAADGEKMVVDHIHSLFNHWDRRLDETNLQCLCNSCNLFGKGRHDETDWRKENENA